MGDDNRRYILKREDIEAMEGTVKVHFLNEDGGTIAIARGSPPRADAVIDTDPSTLRALVFDDRELAGAPVEIRGDARLGRRFFRLFARP